MSLESGFIMSLKIALYPAEVLCLSEWCFYPLQFYNVQLFNVDIFGGDSLSDDMD